MRLESARELAELTGCDRYTADPADIIEDPSIGAVVIGTSTDSHARLIEAAAAAGKQIFCEKPIALDLETTDRAIAAAEAAGVQLQIGFQRRFDKAYAKASQMIGDGKLGNIEVVRDTMRDPSPPHEEYIPTSGGLFRDMVIHDFDCVRWLMGCEPIEVFAMGANLVDPVFAKYGDIDTCTVNIRFESGALGAIDASRRSGFGYDVRTEIFGSKSAVMIGEGRDTPLYRYDSEGVWSDHIYLVSRTVRRCLCGRDSNLRRLSAAGLASADHRRRRAGGAGNGIRGRSIRKRECSRADEPVRRSGRCRDERARAYVALSSRSRRWGADSCRHRVGKLGVHWADRASPGT